MKFKSLNLQIIFAFISSCLAGIFLLFYFNLKLLFFPLFLVAIFFFRKHLFIIYSLLCLFPIVIPISFVNQYPVIGLVAIVLFIVLSFKVFVEKEMIFFSEYSIFYWAIFVILLWTGVSLFRNFSFLSTFSIYDANFKIAAEDYLTIYSGIIVFFWNIYYLKNERFRGMMF